jgi:hypothetical protein
VQVVCIAARGLLCSGHSYFVPSKNTMPQKLTRAQIKAGLDQVPIESLLSSGEGKTPKLTGKMKAFAHAVALGETKANAYRQAYKAKPAPSTMRSAPYELAAHPSVSREIEATRAAIESAKHRTPAQLKALLVHELVQHSLDPEFPPAQRMKALQLIGNLFEVGAFLERKESTVIHKSADIRARLLDRLQARAPSAGPAAEALDLLEEIRGGSTSEAAGADPTAPGAPPAGPRAPGALSHTVSDIQSSDSSLIQTPEKKEGGPSKNSADTVLDFDTE